MHKLRCIGVIAVMGALSAASRAQLVPLSEDVETQLLPSGISSLDANLSANLAYFFKDADGTDAIHLIGDFELKLGEKEGQRILSREAVVWIIPRSAKGRNYLHLQLMLWRDVELIELGGTLTTGPALFVTLNTLGRIHTHIDEVAFESSADRTVYQEGNAIRKVINAKIDERRDQNVFQRVYDLSGISQTSPQPVLPRPLLHVRVEGKLNVTDLPDGGRVLTATGGVFLGRGAVGSGSYLEITAESVVVYLPPSETLPVPEGSFEAGLGEKERAPARKPKQADRKRQPGQNDQLLKTGFGEVAVEAAYLEGDVVMRQGPHMVRADRLYYDFQRERALLLDAVVRTPIAGRNLPLYIRAHEIRQLSRRQFVANNAIFTTSEFHTPHYHLSAGRVELINRTPPNLVGPGGAIRSGTFNLRNVTLNVGGRPIAYWPIIKGNLNTSETAIKSVRTGFSGDFGLEVETNWELFNILGFVEPKGINATLSLDYYTERGPAAGIDAKYEREDYFGLVRSYLLSDQARDNLGRERVSQSKKDIRGRFLLRHRQYLKDDWQISLEFSFLSDRDFLEEFFESEFDNEKEQETLLYLKKQHDNRAFTALLQPRIMDFLTQTERAPDLSYYLIGESLSRNATWYSENRAGLVRFRPADPTFESLLRAGRMHASGTVGRIDTRQEVDLPIDLGPIRFVPFVTVRGSAWDDSIRSGGTSRAFGSAGVRGSLYLSRTDPHRRSELFDINGVRHLVKADAVAWVSGSNRDANELFPFDETVEQIRDAGGMVLGVRQRWQTKRGAQENRRTVDFLTADLEAGFFNNTDGRTITNGFTSFSRPENSLARNFANGSLIWRVNDRTALLSEVNYDVNDGEVDVLNISLAVERPPRLSYLIGYRLIEESDSELFGFDMNYRLTEKHTMAIRELFDLDRGRSLDFTIALIRRFPRWYGAISFAVDEPENDFGVSISIWPEGLPNAVLGSRRFTGLARSTRLFRK